MSGSCLFCRIAAGEIPATIALRDEKARWLAQGATWAASVVLFAP